MFNSDVKDEEMRVTISLHTNGPSAQGGLGKSNLGRRASFMFFGPKRPELSSRPLSGGHAADSNSSPGLTLGEVSFTLNAHVGKSSIKPFSLVSANGKKEVAKIMVQTGLFVDQDYSYEEDLLSQKEIIPEPEVAEYSNYLNVMLYSKSVRSRIYESIK
jgi:hypothetical protein